MLFIAEIHAIIMFLFCGISMTTTNIYIYIYIYISSDSVDVESTVFGNSQILGYTIVKPVYKYI